MSEFGLGLYIFLLLIAFPLIDLFGVACGAGVVLLGAHQAATSASSQRRYTDCLDSMRAEVQQFASSPFARFVKIKPVGGYLGSGADLYIDVSKFVGTGSTAIGPNTPVPPPIDTSTNIYECTVRYHCQIGPLMNMSFMPILGSVPGLGVPAELTLNASRASEYPRGLESPIGTLASASATLPTFSTTPTAPNGPGLDGSGWNNPNLYEMIKANGQTVVASQVIVVPANKNTMTQTTINVQPGEKIYIDTHAEGMWGIAPDIVQYDANGSWNIPGKADYSSFPPNALVGKIGSGPGFMVGDDQINLAPPGTGVLGLQMNDASGVPGYSDNTGAQLVRIVVVK